MIRVKFQDGTKSQLQMIWEAPVDAKPAAGDSAAPDRLFAVLRKAAAKPVAGRPADHWL